jgi:hypothetical protein
MFVVEYQSQSAAGRACDHLTVGDVFTYHRPRTDPHIAANSQAGKNRGAGAHHRIEADAREAQNRSGRRNLNCVIQNRFMFD